MQTEVLKKIDVQSMYESLIFTQLAQRERYDKQVDVFRRAKIAKLTTPEAVLHEEERWIKLLRKYASLYRQKYRNISSAAHF